METPASELPGTGETTHHDDDQGVLVDSPDQREKIAAAGRRLKEIAEAREQLTADKRSILEGIVADGVSRKAIERGWKDCQLSDEKLERQDFWYTVSRSTFGKPIQGQLFPDETKH